MKIEGRVAVVTGGASGIGLAVAEALAQRGAKGLALVDMADSVADAAKKVSALAPDIEVLSFAGNATDEAFRKKVYDDVAEKLGPVSICVPAAGITRDKLAVKVDKETGEASLYPLELFRLVTEVNLIAPTYWALEMVARVASNRKKDGKGGWKPEEDIQGVAIFIGSISSQGNRGQMSYAATKAGLEGVSDTFNMEAMYHGVRSVIVHPGFTETPMVTALGDELIGKHVLPYTQLKRLIKPSEIADAICFAIENPCISRQIWADAGWHPPA